jgi:hypothetical protein
MNDNRETARPLRRLELAIKAGLCDPTCEIGTILEHFQNLCGPYERELRRVVFRKRSGDGRKEYRRERSKNYVVPRQGAVNCRIAVSPQGEEIATDVTDTLWS